MEEVHKKEHDIMRFRLYEVYFDLTCDGHQNTSKIYFMNILRCFNDHQLFPKKLILSEPLLHQMSDILISEK